MGRALALAAVLLALLPAVAAAQDELRPRQWNLDLVESDPAHAVTSGKGATVAVIDSGVEATHPDLAGRLVAGRDIVDNDDTPQDGDGHGTHVLGIVGAATGNGIGVASVAPAASLMPIRVLGDDGSGSVDDVAKGIDWAVDHGAHVINLSLGSDVPLLGTGGSFDAAIRRALSRGIVVVAAAGNNGLPLCEQPSAEGLVCVGSVDKRRARSFFSSFGGARGIVAPGGAGLPAEGEDVLSTYRGGGYAELAGTSQAAPHVAGVAALLVSQGVKGRAAVDRMLATATDLGSPGPDSEYGAGLVNARAAVGGLPPATGGDDGTGGGGGTGDPSGSGGDGASAVAVVRVARRLGLGTVLRRGVRVRVRPPHAGTVRVRVTVGGRLIAREASRRLAANRSVTLAARLTATGRSLVRRARTGGRSLRASVRVSLPGGDGAVTRRVTLGS